MFSNLGTWSFTRGLHDLGDGVYAWLQPDGGWGWSNAGMVVDGDESLIVDTLFDLHLTEEMLKAMRDAEPDAMAAIDTLVNTHANGDHCNGNELVEGAEIIASTATAEEMAQSTNMADLMANAPTMGAVGEFFLQSFSDFDFRGINMTLPSSTFDGERRVTVGDKTIDLIEVGPAHTRGDILVVLKEEKTIFTGDILFIEGHPIIWDGPVQNWINACEAMLAMDIEKIVPGHGPITDKKGVTAVMEYLKYISKEARVRFDAGMDAFEAARDINLSDYSSWGDAERIAVNLASLYREFRGEPAGPAPGEVFRQMAILQRERR